MPLSARCVRTIGPFGEELCALQGGLPGRSQQSCPEVLGRNMPMALCWQMLYCGPLARAIFRLVFRRGAKQAD